MILFMAFRRYWHRVLISRETCHISTLHVFVDSNEVQLVENTSLIDCHNYYGNVSLNFFMLGSLQPQMHHYKD